MIGIAGRLKNALKIPPEIMCTNVQLSKKKNLLLTYVVRKNSKSVMECY